MWDWFRLRPTPEQYRDFATHLCEAHSWYKHIPLLSGRRFVVFVAPDAGIGRLVAVLEGESPETATGYSLVTPPEGSEFTDEHPRLHYSWKTTKEYRSRFGFLDYSCWQTTDQAYARDVGPPIQLPIKIEEQCGFTLYPFVSSTFAEAVIWSVHEEAISQLRGGAGHPAKQNILELAKLAEENQRFWSSLSESEIEWVLSSEYEGMKQEPIEFSPALQTYVEVNKQINVISSLLQAQEAKKIHMALHSLDQLLSQRLS